MPKRKPPHRPKKPNPANNMLVISEYDLKKAKNDAQKKATADAMQNALRLLLYVIIDKHAVPKEDINKLASEVNYVADSINRGYLSWKDIDRVLDQEYDLQIKLN